MSDAAALLRDVEFGISVQEFLRSPIGDYLITRWSDDINSAKEALLTVDPTDPNRVRELQTKAYRALSAQQYLAEAYQAAESAAKLIAGEAASED